MTKLGEPPPADGPRDGAVEVLEVTGQAELITASEEAKPLARGMVFGPGCRIETKTDSKVKLIFSNGFRLEVHPSSIVRFRTFLQVNSPLITEGKYQQLTKEPTPSSINVDILKGKVRGEVDQNYQLHPNTNFKIKTPDNDIDVQTMLRRPGR